MHTVIPKLTYKKPCADEKGHRIQTVTFLDTIDKVVQSGYQSKKEFQDEIAGQDRKYMDIAEGRPTLKMYPIKSDVINQFKNTYRSGMRVEAVDSLNTEDRLILMGAREPALIKAKGLKGDLNGANAHNGWERQRQLAQINL